MGSIASFFHKITPRVFIVLAIAGTLAIGTLSYQSVYAAPEDYTTQDTCEDNDYEWDGDANKCIEAAVSSCGIEGIGWIICPAMDFMGSAADMAFNFLADNFLSTNPTYIKGTGTDTPVYDAWSVMRTFANIAFVIAFMIIVYSQLTSAGISNYGVKKLLPRLIIAAILVNLSFIVCQIAVDVSNILGYSLKTLFEGIGGLITPDGTLDPTAQDDSTAGGMAIFIASLLVAGITLAFTVSVPVLLAIVLALLMIALILVMRIALIITLTIISPLAFVAFLLPNTEQWFKKWYKMFFALLMVFPIISVVFGAGSLVGMVINNAAIAENPDDPNRIMQLIAFGVTAIPLFLVPSLLKSSINAAGAIGTKLSNMASKQQSAAASKGKAKFGERYGNSRLAQFNKHRANERAIRRQRRQGGIGRGPIAALNRGFNNSALSGKFGDRATARAEAFEDELFEKDVKDAALQQNGMTHDALLDVARSKVGSTYTDAAGRSVRVTKEQKTAAMDKVMASGGFNQRREMLEHVAESGSQSEKARAVKAAYAKGDQNIYGVKFGDQILGGEIGGGGMSLADAAVANASAGNLQAEHVVQSGSATEWLQGSIESAGDTKAMDNFRTAADQARQSEGTAAKIDGKMEQAFQSAGSFSGGASPSTDSSQGGTPQISYQSAPTTNINPSTGEVTTTTNFASGQEVMQQIHHASGHEGGATKKSLKAGVGKLSDDQLGELIQQAQTTPGADNDAHYQEVLKVARGEAGRRNGGPPPSAPPPPSGP